MVYKKGDYTLYSREVKLKNTKKAHNIYFFAKNKPKSGKPADLPDHLKAVKNKKTGFMYVKRKE